MNILRSLQWCQSAGIGGLIHRSTWAFAVIESVHLVAFAAIGAAVLCVDFRLLGIGLTRRSPCELAADVEPLLFGSLAVMIVTGVLLFLSEALKCYDSIPFRIKMAALVVAVFYTLTARRDATRDVRGAEASSPKLKLIGAISIALWAIVAWGGRWIGFGS